ncbi:hypothetical protein [Phaeocystidibacter luteus]|uniref:Transporter n=1 Tax=Phaeocystidibacter luteus TaxID=911197 RepID=A0A6N6RMN3_9FLAO|nr:hypothetical protein [Phaeocystidibacter luteus]KAB2814825.1 hypothetical protein F8C67_03490 [Phaeocystidibacter luteus]
MKPLHMAVALTLMSASALGCDACGCRPNSGIWGVGHGFDSSIGLGYQQAVFHSRHPGIFDPEAISTSQELFRQFQLNGGFVIHPKWMVVASIPWVSNVYDIDGEYNTVSSLGDIQVGVRYRIIEPEKERDLGMDGQISLKTPTGEWEDNPLYLPAAILPGTGSWDLNFGARVWKPLSERWLVDAFAGAVIPGENSDGEQFGPRMNFGTSGYFEFFSESDHLALFELGYVGMLDGVDHISVDGRRTPVEKTSGQFHSLTLGITYRLRQFMVRGIVGIPFSQSFADGWVTAQPTAQINFVYTFKKES